MISLFKSHPLFKVISNSLIKTLRTTNISNLLLGLLLGTQIVSRLCLSIYYYGVAGIFIGCFITIGLTFLVYASTYLININYIFYNKFLKPVIRPFLSTKPFVYVAAGIFISPKVDLRPNDVVLSCHCLMLASPETLVDYVRAIESSGLVKFSRPQKDAIRSVLSELCIVVLTNIDIVTEHTFNNLDPVAKVCSKLNLEGINMDAINEVETSPLPSGSSKYLDYEEFKSRVLNE